MKRMEDCPDWDSFCTNWRAGKALNGQCPVCGTMAKPLRKIPLGKQTHLDTPGPDSAVVIENVAYLTTRLERCARCNAAFYQDAEKESQ